LDKLRLFCSAKSGTVQNLLRGKPKIALFQKIGGDTTD